MNLANSKKTPLTFDSIEPEALLKKVDELLARELA